MKFNDHILDYTTGAELFDTAAAQSRLLALIQVMVGLHYRRGFMTAVRAVSSHVRAMRAMPLNRRRVIGASLRCYAIMHGAAVCLRR